MPKKLIVAMQVLEYERSFLASRIFMNRYNGNLIISGAFGIFKKETVLLAGGYDDSTMGEDMELVVKLHVFCRSNHIDLFYTVCARRNLLEPGTEKSQRFDKTKETMAYRAF